MFVERGIECLHRNKVEEQFQPDPGSLMARVSLSQEVANGTYFKSYLFEIRPDSTGLIYADRAMVGECPNWELVYLVRSTERKTSRVLAKLAQWAQTVVSSERAFAAELHGVELGDRSGFDVRWDFECNLTFSR
ncbi:MAG: hypothetical protein BGO23_00395 [Solirubrobacterales bacterium 67-14]|nr:MAG: hypothetical protein BGO23_00395 [Solirubrobacterales bacterium 67-14]